MRSLGDTIRPTYPSKDFLRLLNNQKVAARKLWGDILPDYMGYGTGVPFLSPAYGTAVCDLFKIELDAGEQKHGLLSFPKARDYLNQMRALVKKNSSQNLMLPLDTREFWTLGSKVAIELGSKDFAVTFSEKWRAFAEGAVEGFQKIAIIGDLVRWSVIGGIALAAFFYVVRPLSRRARA